MPTNFIVNFYNRIEKMTGVFLLLRTCASVYVPKKKMVANVIENPNFLNLDFNLAIRFINYSQIICVFILYFYSSRKRSL